MFPYIMFFVLVVRAVVALAESEKNKPEAGYKKQIRNNMKLTRRPKMKWFNGRKILNTGPLFNGHLIDVRAFYMLEFDKVPCINFIGEIDVTNAYRHVNETCRAKIIEIYQHCYYNHDEQQSFFNNTIFLMKDDRMIELGQNYCHVLHKANDYAWANALIKELSVFRVITEAPAQVQVVGFARQPEMN